MRASRNDLARHAGGEPVGLQLTPVVFQLQVHHTVDDQQGLVLLPVILKAEHLSGVDVNHLAEVFFRDREAVLPAPGLLDRAPTLPSPRGGGRILTPAGAARAFLPEPPAS